MNTTLEKLTAVPADESDGSGQKELALICKALGHPARIRILQYLKAADRCICGEIVNILTLAQSTVSQHLKILKQVGLVKGEIEGPSTCYCLNREKLTDFKNLIANL